MDDSAGWDFFDDDNDPFDASSYFAAGNHGSGRASDAAEEGNDGQGSIGVCPRCQIMPLRIWAKLTMMLQAVVSLILAVMVVAWAINNLK